MFEKFITLVERIADALEVIAAAKASAPVAQAEPTKPVEEKKPAAKKAEAVKKTEKVVEEKKVEELSDPLGDSSEPETTKEYTEKEVRDILALLIDKDGRTAAFEVLRDKGNAKAFTDLKKEKYEDVYLECQERLA